MRRALGKLSQTLALVGLIRSVIRNWVPSLFYFRSYSQWGEDSMVSQFIFDNSWTYIDVGSGHPVHGNDTFFLYQRGCAGILVDPIESNGKLSRRLRPRDKFILGIISNVEDIKFFQFSNSGISTALGSRASKLQSDGYSVIREYFPKVYTLTNIFEQLRPGDRKILLKIDVEGLEESVLESLDFSRYSPELIIIEELETLPYELTRIRNILTAKGYELIISGFNSHLFKLKI